MSDEVYVGPLGEGEQIIFLGKNPPVRSVNGQIGDVVVSGSGITLKTNGSNNGSQTILNLKQGTGITIADDGAGGITISSSASGGTVTSVASADGSITVTNPTAAADLAVVKAPKWSTARNLAGNSVDGSANVPFANKFIVQGTVDAGLSGAQFLGALGTGILKSTTTTGILSIAIAADFPTLNQSTTGSAATLTTPRNIAITGDLAWNANFDGSAAVTAAGTLATVNSNVGTFGSATQSVQFTVNGKGLITAAANVTVTPAVGSITGLGTGVGAALAINIGSAGAPVLLGGALGTPSSGTGTNITGIPAANILAGTFGTGAYTMDTRLSVPQILNADNTVTASANAITITRANRNNVVTNNSAATLTVTLSTTSAAAGDMLLVQIVDFSAVAQTITWVNTENSLATVPTTSNGSTTSPVTVGFKWNPLTSKWRCIASA